MEAAAGTSVSLTGCQKNEANEGHGGLGYIYTGMLGFDWKILEVLASFSTIGDPSLECDLTDGKHFPFY